MDLTARPARSGALAWLLPALTFACGSELEPRRPSDVALALSPEIATVVTVTWRTDEPTIGYVEYGETSPMAWSSPFEETPTREHSATLYSLHADTTYSYRVVTWDGDDAGASEIGSFRTGPLPASLPVFTATGTFDSYIAVPIRGASPAVVVVDPFGAIVWYHEDQSGLDLLRARFSGDGRSVLYNRTSVDAESTADSAIIRVALDGSSIEEFRVPFLAHDFVQLDTGGFGAIVVDRRDDADGGSVRGDAIVEISPSGTITPVWSTWDSFDPADTPGDGMNMAWTYANSLFLPSSGGAYYVGLQNFSSVLKVPVGGSDYEWALGSETFDFVDATPFARQSGVARVTGTTSEGMLILDNEGVASGARVVEYSLDAAQGLAVELNSFSPEPSVDVGDLGGVVRLSDGDWVISWGEAGRIDALPRGERAPELTLRVAANLGYHDVTDSLYPADSANRARTPLDP